MICKNSASSIYLLDMVLASVLLEHQSVSYTWHRLCCPRFIDALILLREMTVLALSDLGV